MSYTYDTFRAALALEMVTSTADDNFIAVLPTIIDYAEQRIYRELDLLSTVYSDETGSLSALNRNFTFPRQFIVSQRINVITPPSSSSSVGTRVPLTPVSKDYLDNVWPSSAGATIPSCFAMMTDQSIIVGPWPDDNYKIEVVGTIRPEPLSPTNTTTSLTNSLPDLFLAAAMVAASGYMRNFGSQADDPRMAVSWETQYQSLKASVSIEEARKRYASQAWTSSAPTPLATPPLA